MTEGKEGREYTIGFALSGGGARGFAHLGVLQAFNEKGIFPEIIAGTSAGAFAGVFYADGYTPLEILSFFENKVFRQFAEFSMPQGGIFKTEGLRGFLEKRLRAKTFEELKLPLEVIATDIEYGETKIFTSGEVVPAVIASCSVPIIFRPTQIDGHYYVDGGLFKNLPVTPIRDRCERVVGVNVSPITMMEFKSSIKYVAERSFHYMSVSNTVTDRYLSDYLIESEILAKYSMFDLEHPREIYQIGYDLAIQLFEDKKEDMMKDFPDICL